MSVPLSNPNHGIFIIGEQVLCLCHFFLDMNLHSIHTNNDLNTHLFGKNRIISECFIVLGIRNFVGFRYAIF